MRRIIDNDYVTMASRLILGIAFIWASFYKVIEPASFAKSIWFYQLVPGSLINLMALILPWLELLAGLALIFGVVYRGAILWINVLLIVFIIALGSTIARGISVDCGCFKQAKSATGPAWESLLLDVGMIILSIQLWFSRSRRWLFGRG